MPEVTKEDMKIKLEEGHLVIMGRVHYSESVDRKYIMKETETGTSIEDSKYLKVLTSRKLMQLLKMAFWM